jgi:hypothetical protein
MSIVARHITATTRAMATQFARASALETCV